MTLRPHLALLACAFACLGAAAPAQAQLPGTGGGGGGLGGTVDETLGGVGQTVGGVGQTVDQITQQAPDPVQDTLGGARDTLEQLTGQDPVDGVVPDDPPSQQPGGSAPGSSASGPQSSGGGSQPSGGGGTGQGGGGSGSGGGGDGGGSGGGNGGGSGGSGGGDTPVSSSGGAAADGDGGAGPTDAIEPLAERTDDGPGGVIGQIRDVVEVVPSWLQALLAVLGALVLVLGAAYLIMHRRARRLRRQRERLLDEVGVLQEALLPDVPERLGPVSATVAYRPADGPGAGGDFYDAFELAGGKVAVLVGDVSGHGRQALTKTTLMRYTLRAYLDAGLEPKAALQIAGRTLESDLEGEFATVVVATFDPANGAFTYASAGHPPPLLLGSADHEPVTASSSPPIGVSSTTGLRQTRVGLPAGSIACLFTDGLIEARVEEELLGRERLGEILAELGPTATAADLLGRVRSDSDRAEDDMAACILRPEQGVADSAWRVEELEAEPPDLDGPGRAFLEACGVPEAEVDEALASARRAATKSGRVLLAVKLSPGGDLSVEVSPIRPETLEQAATTTAG